MPVLMSVRPYKKLALVQPNLSRTLTFLYEPEFNWQALTLLSHSLGNLDLDSHIQLSLYVGLLGL